MKLVVGLGNPGFLYTHNRHNVGFMAVSRVAKDLNIVFDRKQGHARTGMGTLGSKKVLVARPQTFMNASGESVSALAKRWDMKPADIIVIHDDLDLPLGKLRLRLGGGPGGHNGLKSIIARLGTQDFHRVRIGIGRPEVDQDNGDDKESMVIDYVLSNFAREEEKVIEAVLPRVSEAVEAIIREGIVEAMNRFN
jgi:peptidyl-tRNA hydrolase, PTH1 family